MGGEFSIRYKYLNEIALTSSVAELHRHIKNIWFDFFKIRVEMLLKMLAVVPAYISVYIPCHYSTVTYEYNAETLSLTTLVRRFRRIPLKSWLVSQTNGKRSGF